MIYLDHNATTPVHLSVREAILPYLGERYGNPSSGHDLGVEAARAVADAREELAALLRCGPDEVVFTGSGSEANNLALKGIAWAHRDRGRHLVVSAVEHPAVLEPARWLAREGWELTIVPVDGAGRVEPAAVAEAIRPDTVLVSIMHANNETGSVNAIAEIAALCHERGVLIHTDAAQSVGKLPTRVDELDVDLLTVAGHKLYAPKGVGALFVRRGVTFESLVHGAGHERGRRAGTENVALIVGLGEAARLARTSGIAAAQERLRPLRDGLHRRLADAVPDLVLNGHLTERLPTTLNVSVPGVLGRAVLDGAPEVAASTGSACHEGVDRPSDVLAAMGVPPDIALGALRLSLGLFTTPADIEQAAESLIRSIQSVRYSASDGQ